MRISIETLMKLANDHVNQRAKKDPEVTAVYLYGSLLGDDPLVGSTGDIDLVFIHGQSMSERREIVRITDDIHLDITHAGRDLYRQARELRLNPWIGPIVNGCKILYDPQHIMDFAQASVRGQFTRADNVMLRAKKQFDHARQIWFDLHADSATPDLEQVQKYLRSIDHAANAIAALSGVPLAERRFLQRFAERANQVGQPALVGKLLGLIGGPQSSPEILRALLPAWQQDYRSLTNPPERLSSHRFNYYYKAFETYLAPDQPYQAVLWPLLRTWTTAVSDFPNSARLPWENALEQLGLAGQGYADCIRDLDLFLDQVEDALEVWSKKMGA